MRKFFAFVLLAGAAGGIIKYESQPTKVAIPVETEDVGYDNGGYYPEQTTTTEMETTTQPQDPKVDFSSPDVTMEVTGSGGDSVRLQEVISKPKHLEELPEEVASTILGCPFATDRDMVVQVDAKVELLSSIPATVSVDYKLAALRSVFEFSSGLTCDASSVNHDLKPGNYSHLTYWVTLPHVITPEYPDGNAQDYSISSDGLVVYLPTGDVTSWKIWGKRAVACDGPGGSPFAKVWFAGRTPITNNDCWEIPTEDEALAQA